MKTIRIIVLVLGLLPTISQASGLCFERPNSNYKPRGSYFWRWHLLDNDARKCWYYANRVLSKTESRWPKSRAAPQPSIPPVPEPQMPEPPMPEQGPQLPTWALEYRWL